MNTTRYGYIVVNFNGMAPTSNGAWGFVCDSEAVVYVDKKEAEEYAQELREEEDNEGIKVVQVIIA